MEYSFDIFDKTPERLASILADNCRKRRLEKGMSRRSLSYCHIPFQIAQEVFWATFPLY